MATFYTARNGLKKGEKSLDQAMKKAMDKDIIEVNESKLNIDQPVVLKNGVTIQGTPGKKRPVLIGKDRQISFMIGATTQGKIVLRHLDIQLGNSGVGLRCNAKNVQLIFDDVHIYHGSKVGTPYNALVLNTQGNADVEFDNCVFDLVQANVRSLSVRNSNIGDWFVETSQLIFAHANFEKTALQNTLLSGKDKSSQAQLTDMMLGGNVQFNRVNASGTNWYLLQLPVLNHRSNVGNEKGDATALLAGPDSVVRVNKPQELLPKDHELKTRLKLPAYRNFGLVGGSLTLLGGYFSNTGLKNVANAGELVMENVSDDSQWEVADEVKLSNRNSESELFDKQNQMNMTGSAMEAKDIKNSKDAVSELNEMIGLGSVKKKLKDIINQAALQREREKRSVKSGGKLRLHMAFLGSPGTGKTRVARLVGQALYESGVLKTTTFVSARQADLVGEHVGETTPKTRELVRSALDGVLFIDEAYELAPPKGGGNTFNNEAVTELIADMENWSDRLVVIMAGYTTDMNDFFQRGNQGLVSRINNFIEFPDYTPKELKKIARYDIKDQNIRFSAKDGKETIKALDKGIDELLPVIPNNAGNGRFINNYIERITELRDSRLAESGNISELSDNQLLIIDRSDIRGAVESISKQYRSLV